MEKQFVKKFDKCPGCGGTERFYGGILEGLKEQGLVAKEVTHFTFQARTGVPLPQTKLAVLPFGAEIPTYAEAWDICTNCGMHYAVGLSVAVAKKSLNVAQPPMNRAQRRRIEQANPGIKFPLNNPATS